MPTTLRHRSPSSPRLAVASKDPSLPTSPHAHQRQPHTSFSPGAGAVRPARSALHSDAPHLDLSGQWQFRLLPGVPGTPGFPAPAGEAADAFAAPDYDDSSWEAITVPSHWVLTGEGK